MSAENVVTEKHSNVYRPKLALGFVASLFPRPINLAIEV